MFGPLTPEETARLARLPRINRAREFYLYAEDGKRWLDCWADGGRALMGHRPKGVSLRLKNEIDRGLYAPYPSRWAGRLEKLLMGLFPGYSAVRVFTNADRALAASGLGELPVDPLDLPPDSRASVLWGRPLLPDHPQADVLFPIMPLPGLSDIQPVMYRSTNQLIPASELVSPVILAAITRSGGSLQDRNSPISIEIADIWERRGPYMLFRGREEEYESLFDTLFAKRILIAPSSSRPSIIPSAVPAGGFGK